MDKVELMDGVLSSMEDHHDRGDETVTASDIAMALGEDEREVRDMLITLVGGSEEVSMVGTPWGPMYWLTNYEEVDGE